MQSLQFEFALLCACHCFPVGLFNLQRSGVCKPNSREVPLTLWHRAWKIVFCFMYYLGGGCYDAFIQLLIFMPRKQAYFILPWPLLPHYVPRRCRVQARIPQLSIRHWRSTTDWGCLAFAHPKSQSLRSIFLPSPYFLAFLTFYLGSVFWPLCSGLCVLSKVICDCHLCKQKN